MGRLIRRRPSWFAITASGLCLLIGWRWIGSPIMISSSLTPGEYQVVGVEDGHTILVKQITLQAVTSEPLRVRLIGVRVLDSVAALNWLRTQTLEHRVTLELDKRRIDSEGVALAYVHLNGKLLNAELCRQGLAAYVSYPGDSARHAKLLQAAVSLAPSQNRD